MYHAWVMTHLIILLLLAGLAAGLVSWLLLALWRVLRAKQKVVNE